MFLVYDRTTHGTVLPDIFGVSGDSLRTGCKTRMFHVTFVCQGLDSSRCQAGIFHVTRRNTGPASLVVM